MWGPRAKKRGRLSSHRQPSRKTPRPTPTSSRFPSSDPSARKDPLSPPGSSAWLCGAAGLREKLRVTVTPGRGEEAANLDAPPLPARSLVDTRSATGLDPSDFVLPHCSAVNWRRGDAGVFSGVQRSAPFLCSPLILPFPSVGSEGCHTPVSKPGLARTRHERAKIQGDPTTVAHGGLTGQMHIPRFSKSSHSWLVN